MFIVNQLNDGYEPGRHTLPGIESEQDSKPDPTLMVRHFCSPASTDEQCRKLIWAVYWQVKQETKTSKARMWPLLTDSYNCRVVRCRRITRKQGQSAIDHIKNCVKEQKYIRVEGGKDRVPLASPPRRLTWEDTGRSRGTKNHITHEPRYEHAAQLCNVPRQITNRRVKVAYQIMAHGHRNVAAVRMTRNALTNALAVSRKRRCVLPNNREPAIPQCDWKLPSPLVIGGDTVLCGSPGVASFHIFPAPQEY